MESKSQRMVIIDPEIINKGEKDLVYSILTSVDIDRPNQRMAEFLTEQNIPFVDLTPHMIDYQGNHKTPLHFIGDSHWTVEGNRFVGESLSEWLVQSQLVLD